MQNSKFLSKEGGKEGFYLLYRDGWRWIDGTKLIKEREKKRRKTVRDRE